MHKTFYKVFLLFILLGVVVSCSDSDNNKENKISTFGNADQLPGEWVVTAKYLEIITSDGDQIRDSEADIIKPMNAIFDNWIKNGTITLTYGPLASFNGQQGGSLDETIRLKGEFQQSLKGNYYVQSNKEDVSIEITSSGIYGGEWISTTKAGVFGSSYYMKQKLRKSDLDILWKMYGDGNREFFSTDQVTMITRAKRIK